jgi:hypothetical protein
MSVEALFNHARSALRTRLKLCTGLPAKRAWEGDDFAPVIGQAFVEDALAGLGSTPRAIGAIEHDLSYIITLKYPTNKGTADIETMAGRLCDHFKVGTNLTFSGTTVLCMKAERRGRIVFEKDWAILTVVVTLWACTTE